MAIFDFSETGPTAPEPRGPGEGQRFPLKTALALLVLATALAAWHWGVDHGKGMSPDIFSEAFQLHWPHAPVAVVSRRLERVASEKLPPVSAVFADDTDSLDPFYAALWKLEQGKQTQG